MLRRWKPLSAVCCAVVIAGLFAGCGDDVIIVQTNPAGTTIFDVQIATNPAVLDFGHVEVNTDKTLTLTIENKGTRKLTLKDIGVDRDSNFQINAFEDVVLQPGDIHEVTVTYRPRAFEAAAANLVILSDDPLLSETTVGLAGRCDPPEINLSPAIFDYGETYIGCKVEQPLYLRNLGDGPLHVYDIDFVTSSEDLSIELSGISFPLDVGPGETVVLDTVFRPLAEEEVTAEVVISSNDPEKAELLGNLTGIGEEAGLITDIIHVSDNGKVDILFVIDNSGSMGDNQSTLAVNFDNFYRIIEDLDLDWQIGVVTTDNGVLQGTTKILTPDTENVREAFSSNALVGTGGSPWEQGLEFGYRALSEPLISGQNSGFLRQEAGLRLIFLSDEPDQSPKSVDFYVSYFQNLKPNPSMVQINAITGGRNGCNDCGTGYEDTRYSDAVDATGGVWASICECDFIEVLEVLAEDAQVFQDTFLLSQEPVEDTIVVTVDDIVSSDWHYDSSRNTVIFNSPDVTPCNGETVTITYELKLDCTD